MSLNIKYNNNNNSNTGQAATTIGTTIKMKQKQVSCNWSTIYPAATKPAHVLIQPLLPKYIVKLPIKGEP